MGTVTVPYDGIVRAVQDCPVPLVQYSTSCDKTVCARGDVRGATYERIPGARENANGTEREDCASCESAGDPRRVAVGCRRERRQQGAVEGGPGCAREDGLGGGVGAKEAKCGGAVGECVDTRRDSGGYRPPGG